MSQRRVGMKAHLEVQARAESAEAALNAINDIRNSIIGLQAINWSEHIYPLVEALDNAGMEGMDYPEARKHFGTTVERTIAAEAALERALADGAMMREALKPFAEAADNALDEMIDKDMQDIWESAAAMSLTVGNLRRARQALSGQHGDKLLAVRATEQRLSKAVAHIRINPGNHWAPPHYTNINATSGPEAEEFLHALADYKIALAALDRTEAEG